MTAEERQTQEKEYKTGDTVWYLAGFVAVRCTILEVEDCFRRKHPDAYLFYWLDEPVGHAVGADDLYDTREAAEAALREAIAESPHEASEPETLGDCRRDRNEFVKSTHLDAATTDDQRRAVEEDWAARRYPDKQRGTDWFTPRDLSDVKFGYQVGEQVWYIGHLNGVVLGIRCTIREVDDQHFRADPHGGILFYVLDEPTASTVAADELYDDRRDAELALADAAKDDQRIADGRGGLDEFRAGCMGAYPPKKHLEEWFGVADLSQILKVE